MSSNKAGNRTILVPVDRLPRQAPGLTPHRAVRPRETGTLCRSVLQYPYSSEGICSIAQAVLWIELGLSKPRTDDPERVGVKKHVFDLMATQDVNAGSLG